MTFSNQFGKFVFEYPEYKGVGETVNIEVLEKINTNKKDTVIVFIYQNTDKDKKARKYIVYPRIFLNFANKHGLIRTQEAVNCYKRADYSGKKSYINEETAHLPFKSCFFYDFESWMEKNGNNI